MRLSPLRGLIGTTSTHCVIHARAVIRVRRGRGWREEEEEGAPKLRFMTYSTTHIRRRGGTTQRCNRPISAVRPPRSSIQDARASKKAPETKTSLIPQEASSLLPPSRYVR